MKKALILILMVNVLPAFSLCPIDAGETVCSIQNFREPYKPSYSVDNPIGKGVQQKVELQPLQRKDPMEQMRSPNNKLNYNSGCQFGICVQEPVKYSEMLNK